MSFVQKTSKNCGSSHLEFFWKLIAPKNASDLPEKQKWEKESFFRIKNWLLLSREHGQYFRTAFL